jgi:hypothetical protein
VTDDEAPYRIIARGPGRIEWADSSMREYMTPKLLALVDGLWESARVESDGHLFNGTFLNFMGLEFGRDGWTVHAQFEEYKYLIAQRRQRDLELGITPIGTSGVCFVEDHVCFARRADHMTYYPGWLELAPSGTIDKAFAREDRTVDVTSKLLDEFEEEARLEREWVVSCEMIGLVLDVPDNNYDICFELHLHCTKQALIDGLSVPGEYHSPVLVERTNLNEFVESNKQHIIPTSLAIVELLSASDSGV